MSGCPNKRARPEAGIGPCRSRARIGRERGREPDGPAGTGRRQGRLVGSRGLASSSRRRRSSWRDVLGTVVASRLRRQAGNQTVRQIGVLTALRVRAGSRTRMLAVEHQLLKLTCLPFHHSNVVQVQPGAGAARGGLCVPAYEAGARPPEQHRPGTPDTIRTCTRWVWTSCLFRLGYRGQMFGPGGNFDADSCYDPPWLPARPSSQRSVPTGDLRGMRPVRSPSLPAAFVAGSTDPGSRENRSSGRSGHYHQSGSPASLANASPSARCFWEVRPSSRVRPEDHDPEGMDRSSIAPEQRGGDWYRRRNSNLHGREPTGY
jgi:hypothetical protein